MYVNHGFILKIIITCIIISFIFPVFSLATDSMFVWSEDSTTSTVNATATRDR